MSTEHRGGIEGASWLNIVLGALVFLTPFFTNELAQFPMWSALLSGAAVILLAGYNAFTARQAHTERAIGPAGVNIVLGLWILVSGFVMAVGTAYVTAMAVYGALIVITAAYNTWAASDARRHTPAA